MSGPEDTPPDFGAAIEDACDESERQAVDILARLKASLPKAKSPPEDPPVED